MRLSVGFPENTAQDVSVQVKKKGETMVKLTRTFEDVIKSRDEIQKLGVYHATPREIPFGTWVWVELSRYADAPRTILGIVIDIRKGRVYGTLERHYTVLTREGQGSFSREKIIIALDSEVKTELLSDAFSHLYSTNL